MNRSYFVPAGGPVMPTERFRYRCVFDLLINPSSRAAK